MHELGIAAEIVRIAGERAGDARIRKIVVQVGKLAAVQPDALRFCFDLATRETPVEGATLEIREVPGRARCRGCDGEVLLDVPFGRCGCGSSDLEWLSGEELRVQELEVA